MTELLLSSHAYAFGMADIYTIRRRNFAAVLALPRIARLQRERDRAALFDLSASMWSQLRRPDYKIGDDMARKIEAAAKLHTGWMDSDHNEGAAVYHPEREGGVKSGSLEPGHPSQNGELDRVMLDAAEAWVRFEEGSGVVFQPVRRLERLMEIARMIRDNGGSLSPEHAQDLIDAARNHHRGK